MTHLRQLMLDELQRRNYSQSTTRCYIHAVEDFAKYFHRSPISFGAGSYPTVSGSSVSRSQVIPGDRSGYGPALCVSSSSRLSGGRTFPITFHFPSVSGDFRPYLTSKRWRG